MAKRVTITYTRQDLDTPWVWQTPSRLVENTMDQYILDNQDKIQQFGSIEGQGLKNIITVTFTDDEIYQEWAAAVQTNVASATTQYCEENNITIDVVTEDI
jgi:hypothetical protein